MNKGQNLRPASENLSQSINVLDRDWQSPPRGITTSEARAVLKWLNGKGTLCHPVSASEYAAQLTGFYPAREVNNAKLYVVGMAALFSAYPSDLVKRVCDPVRGLPGRLKWLPTIADAKEALDAEVSRRMRIEANAKWVVIEAEKLAKEAQAEAEWQGKYGSLTEEERKAKIDILLGRVNLMPTD